MSDVFYFHCTPDGADYLNIYPNQLRILASAYRLKKYAVTKKDLHYAKELFIDSGMVSAWKKQEVDWMYQQQYVIDTANELNADYVAMLDLPMEPDLLALNEFEPGHALGITVQNALEFIDAQVTGKKVFVIQGYQMEEYEKCIDIYRGMGIFDLTDIWIAIGSVCMRSPKRGLYEVCRYVRKRIPDQHIHCFGIGNPKWIRELIRIGIDSFDSASAGIAAGFNRGAFRLNRKRTRPLVKRQFLFEMIHHEHELNRPDPQLRIW